MTPNEKAIELVEKYGIWCWNNGVCDYELAKQCALIAVNEIINSGIHVDFYWDKSTKHIFGYVQYYEEVKQEIEKL